jgi:hypothetical protein
MVQARGSRNQTVEIVFSAADEWLEGKEDIDWVDHWFDLFIPLVVVGTVFGLAGWL